LRPLWRVSVPISFDCSAEHRAVIAEIDPCDDCAAYAEKLRAAGTGVTMLHHEALPHEVFNFPILFDAGAALGEIAQHLRQVSELQA